MAKTAGPRPNEELKATAASSRWLEEFTFSAAV
jgi:hypothetical protein